MAISSVIPIVVVLCLHIDMDPKRETERRCTSMDGFLSRLVQLDHGHHHVPKNENNVVPVLKGGRCPNRAAAGSWKDRLQC
jgi:hypothetical protein